MCFYYRRFFFVMQLLDLLPITQLYYVHKILIKRLSYLIQY